MYRKVENARICLVRLFQAFQSVVEHLDVAAVMANGAPGSTR